MIPDEIKRMRPLTGDERLGANRDSEYLGAEDIDPGTEPILTIDAIYNGMVTLQRGKENKDVITFKEQSVPGIKNVRPLIVNATNRKTLRKIYKSVTANTLVGKRIQLYIDRNVRDPSTGDKIDGIRIRPKVPSGAAVQEEKILCEVCGKPIAAAFGMSAQEWAAYCKKNTGKTMCADCANKHAEEKNAEKGTVNETAETDTE